MNIQVFLEQVRGKYASGEATEHSYRPALQALFESIDPALTVINEPKKSDAGMPDFLFRRGEIPLGWCEAKDIDKDIIKLKGYSIEQRKRYEKAYPNLIYTNGIDFEFIREGVSVHHVSIADFMGQLGGLQPRPDKFEELERQLRLFAEQKPISIRSAAKLAEMMAAKAAIIKDEIGIALADDPEFRSGLGGQFKSFKANLLPALEPDEFADIYAETITYGMFAARFHDDDLTTFSRQEAMEDLPASNPFLKGLFEYIAGPGLPRRLIYIVDDLVALMRASDPHSLFRDFGKFTARNDPFVHFYEDFLAAYNPKKRKSRGVWYTPEPVVDFIVRAVDDVLKTEFGLVDGLADTSKVTVDWDTGTNDPKTGKAVTIKKEVHKVQILDPATGTGTFLAKAVQLISDRVKARAPGKWSGYVEQDLLPRLHGFELLMASYAMCHMKLDMQLTESGYKPSATPPRLSVWLTNSLEPAEREVKDLFFQPLADEARGASEVKRQSPIMCVIGNPPYSGESANKGDHIMGLMDAYKKEPGGKERLNERNSKWINDDYVKFIRMSEDLIAQNPSGGVLGFITNHGYLNNPTFRGMRWHLLKTFDKIWVVDLHGNSKKLEVSPNGSIDKNVFDIQQGVALIIAVRKEAGSEELAQVWHGDVWGSRQAKSDILWGSDRTEAAKSLLLLKPNEYPFVHRNDAIERDYVIGFGLNDLYPHHAIGIITKRDAVVLNEKRSVIETLVANLRSQPLEMLRQLHPEIEDVAGWSLARAKQNVISTAGSGSIEQVLNFPFDIKYTYHSNQSLGFLARPVYPTMRQFYSPNFGLMFTRMTNDDFSVFTSSHMVTHKSGSRYDGTYLAPIYLYPDEASEQSDAFSKSYRTLNLEPKLYAAICAAAGIDPTDQAGPDDDFRAATGVARPSEVKVFDYIYGVLHSPAYRATFAEFLKIDFPRIPYPASPEVFRHVSEKGEALRRLHLMEAAAIGDTPFVFHGDGDGVVATGYPKFERNPPRPSTSSGGEVARSDGGVPAFDKHGAGGQAGPLRPLEGAPPRSGEDLGRVYINKDQHFADVPHIAWGFHIGGYQPAQKWLKDRRGRVLSWDDIGHYQKIVKILTETDRIMKLIELPLAPDS